MSGVTPKSRTRRALRWLVLLAVGCGARPGAKVPKVIGWVGETAAMSVAGPMLLACDGPCQGSLADSMARAGNEQIPVTFTRQDAQWVGVPKIRLAYATHYALALPTSVLAPPLAFTTEPDPTTAPSVNIWPTTTAPANLAWMVLSFSPPVARGGVLDLVLIDGDVQVSPAWIDVEQGMVDHAILWGPFSDPRCLDGETQQLCDGKTYTLSSRSGLRAAAGAALVSAGQLAVGVAVTDALAWESAGSAVANDAAVRIARATNRECLLSAAVPLEGNSGPRWPLQLSSGAALASRVTPDSDYVWSVLCRDAAGNQTPIWSFAFRTQPLVAVRMSEIVAQPLQDWNDSSGNAGQPYDATPGPGNPGPPDAYAELLNSGLQPADLSAWHLQMGSSSDQVLGDLWQAKPQRAWGSLPLLPGARAVVRLASPGSAAGVHAQIVMRDALGMVRDEATLGADGVPDGGAANVSSEAVSRCPDEGGAWQKTAATPGAANACPP